MKALVESVRQIQFERLIITIRLTSGLEIDLYSELYKDGDIQEFLGKEIDILLYGMRSPYVEHKLIPNYNSPFQLETEFMKFDLMEEISSSVILIG